VSYVDELSRELAAVGIRGARRRRILAEVDDHLRSSGDVESFGAPCLVAQRFADELATVSARRAAVATFIGLVPAGLAYAALVLGWGTGPDITSARTLPVGLLAATVMLLAPQVALASGVLAVLRAWHLRERATAPAAELRIVRRRAALAAGSGVLTVGAVLVYAYEYSAGLPGSWLATAVATSVVAVLALVPAAATLASSSALRPAVAGAAGDLTDDLEPLLRHAPAVVATPWRICVLLGAFVALAALVGAGLEEGPRNAIGEAVAIVVGFAAFGRFLGLRR
jgi:hypothetical protein